jgi:hypothetical protein
MAARRILLEPRLCLTEIHQLSQYYNAALVLPVARRPGSPIEAAGKATYGELARDWLIFVVI